jgi:hypothetical protein
MPNFNTPRTKQLKNLRYYGAYWKTNFFVGRVFHACIMMKETEQQLENQNAMLHSILARYGSIDLGHSSFSDNY